MIAVLQRVSRAQVTVEGRVVGAIERGLVVLLGVATGDDGQDVDWMARKIASLRVFQDAAGKMNFDIRQINGSILLVSQFTLLADLSGGNRPSFTLAEEPSLARRRIEEVATHLKTSGIAVAQGEFGTSMLVTLDNDGPVTILLDSRSRPTGSNPTNSSERLK